MTIELLGYKDSGEQVLPTGRTQTSRWQEIVQVCVCLCLYVCSNINRCLRLSAFLFFFLPFFFFFTLIHTNTHTPTRTQTSKRTISLIDLCGHERYLKTTVFGLTGMLPDFALLLVGGNMGVQVMTKEHISIACALQVCVCVCLTCVCVVWVVGG